MLDLPIPESHLAPLTATLREVRQLRKVAATDRQKLRLIKLVNQVWMLTTPTPKSLVLH